MNHISAAAYGADERDISLADAGGFPGYVPTSIAMNHVSVSCFTVRTSAACPSLTLKGFLVIPCTAAG